ncbi:MAG TPA: SDR family oxidoreductase [Vicinamibacterales bacterium]|nr:SDR family oxidoreductase [Vicinamibacterales bacterium]
METGLKDKVAIVCAASEGLGRATADALAAEGCRLAICSRRAPAIEQAAAEIRRTHGVEVMPLAADLRHAADISRLVATAVEQFGGVDVLVTNVGGPKPGLFDALSDSDWYDAVDLLLMSAVRLCREVIPHMRKRGGGRIIHITSIAVKQPVAGLMLSNAVRAAVVGFSKTLSRELAADRITVNCVAPGYTRTARVTRLNEATAQREGKPVSDVEQRLLANIPAGRLGEPGELAALIAFLASARSGYITGSVVQVDGGSFAGLL